MKVLVTVGLDPGIGGAVGILVGSQAIVVDTPLIEQKIKRKSKSGKNKGKMIEVNDRQFDLKAMYHLLAGFKDSTDVVVAIEKVGVSAGDGAPQMFNFGKGVGYWEMAAVACGYSLVQVRPQVWKEGFPEILQDETVLSHREEIAALKAQMKLAKDKSLKNRINKDLASANRSLKSAAKDAARAAAAKFYPDIAASFELKNTMGARGDSDRPIRSAKWASKVMNWFKRAFEIRDFGDRNVVNENIRYFEMVFEELEKLGGIVFQDARQAKNRVTTLANDKKLSSYPLIRDLLLEADMTALDSPWRFQEQMKLANEEVTSRIKVLEKERKRFVDEVLPERLKAIGTPTNE
ncbi:MAG: hypothetical protein HC888_00130 [Candidatus Competibacteraceae bacterium]|nr:hypothetical protein [Candidatus Competibacteraceae bacterium]